MTQKTIITVARFESNTADTVVERRIEEAQQRLFQKVSDAIKKVPTGYNAKSDRWVQRDAIVVGDTVYCVLEAYIEVTKKRKPKKKKKAKPKKPEE